MTPHEQNLILKVADEVRMADRTAVDREAERLIRAEVAAQPNAAYILTQRVIVQDLALQQARARIDELEARLRSAGAPVPGPGGATGGAAPPESAPSSGARSGVGDFLKTAAAAAAGTIGAELIYDGLRHWAAGHGGLGSGLFSGPSGGFLPSGAGQGNSGAYTLPPGGGDDGDFGHMPIGTDVASEYPSGRYAGTYRLSPDQGGGGDFGVDSGADAEGADKDTDEDTDEDTGGGGDWGDEATGGDDGTGGGGDW